MNSARILIIDDNATVRAELKERIESMGHEWDEASYQIEGLKKVQDMEFDCVLLDLEIPMNLEGVAHVNHGKNLLQRIVALQDAPPVIVVTSHGTKGHRLAVEMMELGAATFVSKAFDEEPPETKIQMVLGRAKPKTAVGSNKLVPFAGGALVLNEDCIELCGIVVGGVRANAIIRRVVEILADKLNGKYVKRSAMKLAGAITLSLGAPSVVSAINDFREQCAERMREKGIACGKNDVIRTAKGGAARWYHRCQETYPFVPERGVRRARVHSL